MQIIVATTTAFLVAGRFGLAPTVKRGATAGLKLVEDPDAAGLKTGDPAGKFQFQTTHFCAESSPCGRNKASLLALLLIPYWGKHIHEVGQLDAGTMESLLQEGEESSPKATACRERASCYAIGH